MQRASAFVDNGLLRLPDVVYVGYMRSGSTYLRGYFSAHPQIEWFRNTWYLQLGRSDEERRATYCQLFRSVGPERCLIDMYEGLCLSQYFMMPPEKDYSSGNHPEWSPDWAIEPGAPLQTGPISIDPAEIARRLHDCVPHGKVLVVLRNQLEWLRSMYVDYLTYLPPQKRRFREFLNTREGKSALNAGHFDRVLRDLFAFFPPERGHVMLFEQLQHNEQDVLRGLCRFLGVEYLPCDLKEADRNAQRRDGVRLARGRLLRFLARLGWQVGILTKVERSFLRAFYSASNLRTSQMLSVDLSKYGYPC